MSKVVAKRVSARIDGDFVVFLIGIYSGMPPYDLAKTSTTVVTAGSMDSARGRIEAGAYSGGRETVRT